MAHTSPAPPASVLTAFGAGEPVWPIAGGQGSAWRATRLSGGPSPTGSAPGGVPLGLVLKPTGLPAEADWRAEVLAGLPESAGFRVARPVRALDGAWTACGWEAWHEVVGEPDLNRHDEILTACAAFHEALAGLPRPGFLDDRDDPGTYGERVAWQELPIDGPAVWVEVLERVGRARRPVRLPAQPVHGDPPGNVLFADGLPPAVIDWPVFYRPATWALAVAAIDLITWYGGQADLLRRWAHSPGWDQMLVRALIYRMATNVGCLRLGVPLRERPEDYRTVVNVVLARTGG